MSTQHRTFKNHALFSLLLSFSMLTPVFADTVKITPLGSHSGEFCSRDRALIFEDPDGTRLLYDAGRTVAGATDARLGKIDVVLVSHMHGDHVGNQHIKQLNEGSCSKPKTSVNELIKPNAVIASHANETATKLGKVISGTRTDTFIKATRVPVHIPLSGKSMKFNRNAKCMSGC